MWLAIPRRRMAETFMFSLSIGFRSFAIFLECLCMSHAQSPTIYNATIPRTPFPYSQSVICASCISSIIVFLTRSLVLKLISCRINSIDKSRLSADSYSYSDNGIAWKARVILFVGFALMAGGLAGAVTVLVLKYLVHDYPFPTLGFGVSNVVANALVMLR